MHDDRIARFHVHDGGTDFNDLRRGFVTEQVRKKLVGALGGRDFVQLRAADRRMKNFDQHLPGGEGVGKFDLVDDQRLAGFRKNGRFSFFDLHVS